jgi:hypothetical protein
MKAIKKTETKYNKVVNIDKEGNEIIILDRVFNDNDGFKGAVGNKFEPISKSHYKTIMSKDNMIDRIIDSGILTAPSKDLEYKFAEVVYKEMKANGELEEWVFDLSYKNELWNELRKYGYPKSKYPIFNCIGGGRCFDSNFEGNTNVELSKIIREIESE